MTRVTTIWRHMRARLGIGRTARREGGPAVAGCMLERLEPRVLLSAGVAAAANDCLLNGADGLSAPLGETGIEVGVNPADLSGQVLQQDPAFSEYADDTSGQAVEPDLLKLPLAFEVNGGQTDPVVDFLARGSGYSVFLTGGDAVLRLDGGDAWHVVRIDLLGAVERPEVAGLDLLGGHSNYFVGSDPDHWYTDIANYGSVEYTGVYDGVDIRYYGNQRQLEYDFLIAAGADPNVIRLAFQGVESVSVDESGGLVLQLSADGGEIRFHAPVSYQQTADGQRETVASRYVVSADGTVGFEVGPYDASRPLVVDPVLDYGTYLGGTGNDRSQAVALDDSGNVYIAGRTSSADFPFTGGAVDPTYNGDSDVFVAEISADGSSLIYSTFLGGSASEQAFDIFVFSSGAVYVAGQTMSSDFPTSSGAYDSTLGGPSDGFVAKLNPAKGNLIYSTYLGGAQNDACLALTVDSDGRAFVTGTTESSSEFPVTPDAFQSSLNGSSDIFLVRLGPSGVQLDYGTYLGGSGTAVERGNGIAIDDAGRVYLTGSTGAGDFPTTPDAYDRTFNGDQDAFLVKFDPATSSLLYSTYLGGAGADEGRGIFLDGSGNVYLVGDTDSAAFPTTPGAYDRTHNGATDAFVARFDAAYSLAYATYFGGAGIDHGNDIAVDGTGWAHIAGQTDSGDLPTTADAHQSVLRGAADAYVAILDVAGATLVYSTYLGGAGIDAGTGIVLDHAANIYVTGYVGAGGFDTTAGAYDETYNGAEDAFVAKFTATGSPTYAPHVDLDADDSSGRSGADFAAVFQEGLGPVAVADVDALIRDLDSVNLVRLTVTITNLRDGAAESLSVDTAGTSILAGYDSNVGVLTLSGVDTVAHYQQVLRTIRYNNTSADPDTTPRLITFVANDGSNNGNVATATVTIVARNDAPTLADVEGTPLACTENDPARPVTDTITVGDVDDTHVESATVRITGNYRIGEDVLGFVDTATITGSWNPATGTLRLTGSDSLANYQAALRSVTYRNASENPGTLTRTVTFTVSDGADDSNSVTRDITITAVNDAPIISDQVFHAIGWGIPGTVVGVIAVTDPDGAAVTYRIIAGNTNGDLAVDPATGTITLNREGGLGGARETLIMEVEVTDDGTPPLSSTAVITVVVDFLPDDTFPPAQDKSDPGDDTAAETSPNEPSAPDPDGGAGPARRPDELRGAAAGGLAPTANFALPGRTPGAPAATVVHASVTAPVVRMSEAHLAEESPAFTVTRPAERLLPQRGNLIGEFQAQITRQGRVQSVRIGVTAALAGTISVGYVIWLLRGGALLTAVLSSLPAWQFVDPLPVLDAWASRRKREARDRETAGKDEDETERRVQSIFE